MHFFLLLLVVDMSKCLIHCIVHTVQLILSHMVGIVAQPVQMTTDNQRHGFSGALEDTECLFD